MKFLIVTSYANTLNWPSLPNKLAAIGRVLPGPVSVIYSDIRPTVKNGRITHEWFTSFQEPYFNQGYDFVLFHMSERQARDWGIKPEVRGANPRMLGEIEQAYFWANERTMRGDYNQFIETALHEIKHGYHYQTKTKDTTHEDHDRDGTIMLSMARLDWSLYQPRRMRLKMLYNALRAIVTALSALVAIQTPKTLHKRLPDPYNNNISQEYGEKNPAYTLTGRHIGVDYACPLGTTVYAPWDGEVTVVGEHSTLGKFCYYQYIWEGKTRVERYLHLSEVPKRGKYIRGGVVAKTGNTGWSTGPHFHVDGWYNEVNTGSVNKTNWDKLTYNPHINE